MKPNIIAITLLSLVSVMALVPSSHAQTAAVNQAPAVSEEARKHFVMGATLFKDAKSTEDFALAIGKFKQATELAPQWPEARYNLARAKEAAGDYSGAMADLKIYQQFKLPDDEARKIQDKLYVLEAKQEQAAKTETEKAQQAQLAAEKAAQEQQAARAAAARQANATPAWLKDLDGARFVWQSPDRRIPAQVIDIKGKTAIRSINGQQECFRCEIREHSFRSPPSSWATVGSYIISDDGETIDEVTEPPAIVEHHIFRRQR